MTMETVVVTQQDGSVSDSLTDGESSQSDSNSPNASLTQVSGDCASVTLVQLPGGQMVRLSGVTGQMVQGVIQMPQPTVIQPPQMQTVQVAAIAEEEAEIVSDSQKRREILSRRPSYRKILSELSSDATAVPKIEEEEKTEEEVVPSSCVATVTVPPSIYQTSSGQYITITQGGAIHISGPGGEGLQGLQTPGATILQSTPQPTDPNYQFILPGGQVVVQAATGDMPAYQLRSPSTGLPQAVVMAASPGAMHSPQQHTEEVTRKREVRLMKNREAARECRKKKKEYVRCLENRVAVLENQNKTLIEELKALKDIYCHKAE